MFPVVTRGWRNWQVAVNVRIVSITIAVAVTAGDPFSCSYGGGGSYGSFSGDSGGRFSYGFGGSFYSGSSCCFNGDTLGTCGDFKRATGDGWVVIRCCMATGSVVCSVTGTTRRFV